MEFIRPSWTRRSSSGGGPHDVQGGRRRQPCELARGGALASEGRRGRDSVMNKRLAIGFATIAALVGCDSGPGSQMTDVDAPSMAPDATGDTAPAAPSGLSATAASSNTISLTWNDNSSNESGFKLERATSASGPFAE